MTQKNRRELNLVLGEQINMKAEKRQRKQVHKK